MKVGVFGEKEVIISLYLGDDWTTKMVGVSIGIIDVEFTKKEFEELIALYEKEVRKHDKKQKKKW